MASAAWTSADDDSPRGRQARCVALSDVALVAALRRGDDAALLEFLRRFEPVVALQARRHRIDRGERAAWTAERLYEVASHLAVGTEEAPRSIAAYLVVACRRVVLNAERDRLTRERLEVREATDAGTGERVLASTTSEASLRDAAGPDPSDAVAPAPVLARLVATIETMLRDDERQLLAWAAQRVPYSMIATWLGIGRSAAVKRVTRLRERLRALTVRFGRTLDDDEWTELMRFLRRAGGDQDVLQDLRRDALADGRMHGASRAVPADLDAAERGSPT